MELRKEKWQIEGKSRAASTVTWYSPKPQSPEWAPEILLSSLLTHPSVAFSLSFYWQVEYVCGGNLNCLARKY